MLHDSLLNCGLDVSAAVKPALAGKGDQVPGQDLPPSAVMRSPSLKASQPAQQSLLSLLALSGLRQEVAQRVHIGPDHQGILSDLRMVFANNCARSVLLLCHPSVPGSLGYQSQSSLDALLVAAIDHDELPDLPGCWFSWLVFRDELLQVLVHIANAQPERQLQDMVQEPVMHEPHTDVSSFKNIGLHL